MAKWQQTRSFWTWGWTEDEPTEAQREQAARVLSERFGRTVTPPPIPQLQDIQLSASRIDVPSKLQTVVSQTHDERALHTYGGHPLELLRAVRLVADTGLLLISDEVYEHIIFDSEKHQSACLFKGLKSRSFITASFGKTFHNTGWKMGYCCAPKELMDEFRKVHQFNVFAVNHPMQKGIADYLQEPDTYLGLPKFYQEKRDYFLSLIKDSRFKINPSQGTYFQVLDYSQITQEYDVEFAKRLTKENSIASIPMSVFNEPGKDDKVLRFCFAKTNETLEKAAEILNKI